MKNGSISKQINKRKPGTHASKELREFLADYHNFTNKWPTQKIAKLPEINMTRQNIYKLAAKGDHE